ncbi:helix-turn-helix domain-containing protein [Cohnella suwonensis]|uniref:Helix-turn-helix domain-containing protein n=1 Tax=Cohnella suwonensis TaxID=696072 RepID=A0ABW0M117_9BACL
MIRSVQTFKSEHFFDDGFPLYVNRATETFHIPLHDHDFIEFAYVAEGGGFHHIDGEVREAAKGQLIFIPIGTSHVFRPASTNPDKQALIVYNCLFSPRLLEKLAGIASDPALLADLRLMQDGRLSSYTLRDADDAIGKLFLQLHREYSLPRQGTNDFLCALLLQLLVVALRARSDAPSPASRKFDRFDQLLAYMESHMAEPLTLSRLARVSLWSERHLQRLFLRHADQPFHLYLQSMRIRRSCELLRHTPLKIAAIAEEVGYKDIASFLSAFKNHAGQTPSAYRKAAGADRT